MILGLVRKGLELTAPYQNFDEINSGLPEHRRTRGEETATYWHPAMEANFHYNGGAVYHLYV